MTGLRQTTRGEIFVSMEAVTAVEACGDREPAVDPKGGVDTTLECPALQVALRSTLHVQAAS
jgi:hypothetical protein